MLNYPKIGTAYLEQLASNSVVDRYSDFVVDLLVASIIEWYYGPTKFLMNASNLDFSVWPNAKIVEHLYKDIQYPTQSLCG